VKKRTRRCATACLRMTDLKKRIIYDRVPALWCNTACLRWLGAKKQSETVGPGALCVQLTGFEKTNRP
jgi:hypothetical protein